MRQATHAHALQALAAAEVDQLQARAQAEWRVEELRAEADEAEADEARTVEETARLRADLAET